MQHSASGLGGIALASLLAQNRLLGSLKNSSKPIRPQIRPGAPLASRPPHHEPKAKQVLVIFCAGGCSQLETFDYKPTAALLTDLKARGLLEDTLVLWTTEFGRMPTFQKGSRGRDHNPGGFTIWMTGAGVKPGFSYGATDELGFKAIENVTTIYDLHATLLHLLGLDHERLTFYHNDLERRLTDVHGHVVSDILS